MYETKILDASVRFEINIAMKSKVVEREVKSCGSCPQPWARTPGNGGRAARETKGQG